MKADYKSLSLANQVYDIIESKIIWSTRHTN